MSSIHATLINATKRLNPITDTPQLEAEILLCQVLNKQRSYLRAWPERKLTELQNVQYQTLVLRREQGTPIAYITGIREFWSRNFSVSPEVLIPRPDTELIVQLSLDLIGETLAIRVLDLGTGSGAIAITLAAEQPGIVVTATDISIAALNIARMNAQRHQASNISFHQSQWFDQLPKQKFDIIVSNPPYIAADDPHLHQGDLRFEPQAALVSKQSGLQDITEIVQNAPDYLNHSGHLLIEHGYNQGPQVQNIFKLYQYKKVVTYNDWADQPRVTSATWSH